jgi:hypothetical protein
MSLHNKCTPVYCHAGSAALSRRGFLQKIYPKKALLAYDHIAVATIRLEGSTMSHQMHQITFTPENGGVSDSNCVLDGGDGSIEISIIIPNVGIEMCIIEMQAIACEHVVEAMSQRAAGF